MRAGSTSRERGSAGRVAVVGAGIAGLAAAYRLLGEMPGLELTVLEASPRVGGKLRTGEIAGQPIDLGAEALLNRRPDAVRLARDVGLGDGIVYPITTSAGIWTRGAVRRLPPTVLGIPTDLEALAASGIVARSSVARARLERWMRPLDVTEDVAVGQLVARRLGREVLDRLVEPMLGGVYAGHAARLSLHASMPELVGAIAEHGSLLAAAGALRPRTPPPDASAAEEAPAAPVPAPVRAPFPAPVCAGAPVFAGIVGGVGTLASATADAVRRAGAEIVCRAPVRELEQTVGGFRLVYGPTVAPQLLDVDAVVVATPAGPAARLLAQVAPGASLELAGVEYASVALVTVALDTADEPAGLQGSGFLVPPVDGQAIKAATFSSRKWGWHDGSELIVRCSLGRHHEEAVLQREDGDLVPLALRDLRAATGISARVVDANVARWGGALPQYAVGHRERIDRARAAIHAVPGLEVCGAAYDGVGIAACVGDGSRAADALVQTLRERERMRG